VGFSKAEEAAGRERERERRENVGWNINKGEADFLRFLDSIVSSLRSSTEPLFIAVEEGNLVYTGVKFQPLIWLGRIPTIGSK
jgi:hypothetical protein